MWQERAAKLVAESHQRLLEQYRDGQPLPGTMAVWLQERGIPLAAVVKNRLGWLEGELDLHTAVDELAADAKRQGIDTGFAQQVMAAEFGAVR